MLVDVPLMMTFNLTDNAKEQALKILEEAGEVVDAVKQGNKESISYEIMDLFQATANLCALTGITDEDLAHSYYLVRQHNYRRGRI